MNQTDRQPDATMHDLRVFADARVLAHDHFTEPQDVITAGGRVVEIAPAGTGASRASSLGTADVTEVDGRYLLPGFIESHGHPVGFGINRLRVDLSPSAVSSIADIQAAMHDSIKQSDPGAWVIGTGFDETYLNDGRMPDRGDLDSIAPSNPVALSRTCGHMVVVNSHALAVSGLDESVVDPSGGKFVRDAAGRLTGLVQEDATRLIAQPEPDDATREEGFALAQESFHSWGVTTVNDAIAEPDDMRLYQRLNMTGRLKVRMRPWLYAIGLSGRAGVLEELVAAGISSGLGDDMLRLQGVKFQLDGSLGGRTAALYEPYAGSDDRGILTHPTARLVSAFRTAARGGLRMAIHAIGDAAIGQALEALEASGEQPWITANRNRIEHCSLPTPSQMDMMAEWNLIASSSIGFVYNLGDSYPAALGDERIERLLPHRDLAARGIIAPGNSDVPVTSGNPWHGIFGAVTRTTRTGKVLDSEQNISLAQALAAYTSDAAYANFEEDRSGTIAAGSFADFQLYDRDPFALDPEELLELAPEAVFLSGEKVRGGN